MIKLTYLLLLLSLFACKHPESKDSTRYKNSTTADEATKTETSTEKDLKTISYKVIGIKDGDTFVVLMNGKEQVIRLDHIDCPEKKQPFGTKAKLFASDLCFGEFVYLKHKNKYDRYKRLLAEVILTDGVNVNQELVRNGLAWHFKKYSKNPYYAALEIKAKNNRVGIWSEPNPMAPWNWRKRN
jgi:endonuclease YncB( thermonuclease family)